MKRDLLIEHNEEKLNKVASVIFRTVDMFINGETKGILKKPNTSKELEDFTAVLKDTVSNKIRHKLGV